MLGEVSLHCIGGNLSSVEFRNFAFRDNNILDFGEYPNRRFMNYGNEKDSSLISTRIAAQKEVWH